MEEVLIEAFWQAYAYTLKHPHMCKLQLLVNAYYLQLLMHTINKFPDTIWSSNLDLGYPLKNKVDQRFHQVSHLTPLVVFKMQSVILSNLLYSNFNFIACAEDDISWSNDLIVKVLDTQSRSCVFKSTEWL